MGSPQHINLGKVETEKPKQKRHTPSIVQPDTLFHFVTELEYLITGLKEQRIYPRYCSEDCRYLKLPRTRVIAFPMLCFCNIGLQKLEPHMKYYGYYGIAFPKDWCIAQRFQTIHYLNEGGYLAGDIREAFRYSQKALKAVGEDETLSDYLLHELMYYKPFEGKAVAKAGDGKKHSKCFTDECEWRFIPRDVPNGMQRIVTDPWTINNFLKEYSDALRADPSTSLPFSYDDLKYVIVRSRDDFSTLLEQIEKWDIGNVDRHKLLAKVLVWDEIKGDF